MAKYRIKGVPHEVDLMSLNIKLRDGGDDYFIVEMNKRVDEVFSADTELVDENIPVYGPYLYFRDNYELESLIYEKDINSEEIVVFLSKEEEHFFQKLINDYLGIKMLSFFDDVEKMRDFFVLSKKEFLNSYSYLSEAEYDATVEDVKNRIATKTENSLRKVLITNGMSNDKLLFLTDASKEDIETWCIRYNKQLEDGGYYELFDSLKTLHYVKELLDSEIDDADAFEVLGFDESYDLANYVVKETAIYAVYIDSQFDRAKPSDAEYFVDKEVAIDVANALKEQYQYSDTWTLSDEFDGEEITDSDNSIRFVHKEAGEELDVVIETIVVKGGFHE